MIIYLAGTPGTKEREQQWIQLIHGRLLSYWDIFQDQFAVLYAFKLIKVNNKKVDK